MSEEKQKPRIIPRKVKAWLGKGDSRRVSVHNRSYAQAGLADRLPSFDDFERTERERGSR